MLVLQIQENPSVVTLVGYPVDSIIVQFKKELITSTFNLVQYHP